MLKFNVEGLKANQNQPLPTGVVVSFMKAGFGGSIHPRQKRKRGWLPKGIMDSITQKMALS